MKFLKAIYLLAAFLTLGLLSSCHHNDDPVPVPESKTGTHTVLVYMAADNTLGPFDKSDIEEMKKGFANQGIDTSKNNLLIYVDDYTTLPTIYRLVRDANGNVTDEILYEYATDHDSCLPSVIQDVISRVKSAYPAEEYGFVYWSHGEGWVSYPLPQKALKPMAGTGLKWIGRDVTATDISDLKRVLQTAYAQSLDFLMFDACFMLTVETVYELKDVADYIISSPTEIPGPGAPYDIIVPKMFGSNAAQNIVKSYYDYYAAQYDESTISTNTNWTSGVSIGAVKTSALENLAIVTKRVLPNHKAFELQTLKNSVLNYDRRTKTSSSYIGYYDFYRVMEQLLSTSDFNTWKAAFDATMASFLTTPLNYSAFVGPFSMEGAKGLSLFLPLTEDASSDFDLSYHKTSWYTAAGISALGW